MARVPYAAEVFIAQVKVAHPKAEVEPFGDPDGLEVYREFRIDKRTSEKLAPVLEVLDDPRIHSVNLTEAGYLHVEFSPRSVLADDRREFPLAEAWLVASGESADGA